MQVGVAHEGLVLLNLPAESVNNMPSRALLPAYLGLQQACLYHQKLDVNTEDTLCPVLQHFSSAWPHCFTHHSNCLLNAITSLIQARRSIMDSLLKTPTNSSIITYPSCNLATPIMDGTAYPTHTHTVYLNANKSPAFLQNIRHWSISSTHGIAPPIDPHDNTTFLGRLPGRIVTVPMLHRSCHLQIMAVLLLVWIYALYCRLPQARQAISRLDMIRSSLLLLVVSRYAYADHFTMCGSMVAAAAIVSSERLDVLGMFAVLTLAHKGWYLTAITLTVAYAV